MKRIGVLDIGSNSVRLVLVEVDGNGAFRIVDDLKESVRLGADMIDGNLLNEERMEKAIATLKSFKSFCLSVNVMEIIAVATEAVRKAGNKELFLGRVKAEAGIDIRILTGDEEAYYDSLGIINSMYVENSLIIDIGGSSTELAWVCNNELKDCISLPFGAVNLTQKYNMEDIICISSEDSLKKYLTETYTSVHWLTSVKFDNIIGIGGTIRNLGKIDRISKRYPLDIHHNYEMTIDDIHNIYNSVKSKNLRQRKKIDGLSKDRADIFVAPVCAVYTLMELLSINTMIVSGKGLREGVIYEYINRNYEPIGDVLDYSLKNVLINHNINKNHAFNVFRLTLSLFDKLKSLHHLDADFEKIIKTASMLHDSGLSVRYYDHHKHSFYMIINSEINGLSHKELIMSAYAAASHRNRDFDLNVFQYHGIINKMDLAKVEKLGALLRLAESLDKSMTGKIQDVRCTFDGSTVELKVISEDKVDFEISEAMKAAEYFKEVYDKDLVITQR